MREPDDTAGEVVLPRKRRHEKLPSFDSYSDEQWQQIKAIVAKLDLDANSVRVGNSRTLLCEALEGLASRYRLDIYIDRLQLTPRRALKELGDTIAAIKSVQRRLNIFGSIVANYAPAQAQAASKALQDFVIASELHSRLDVAREAGSGSVRNASKSQRRAYLIELEKIWRGLVSQQSPQRKLKSERKLKENFLLACAAPTFAVDAFVVKHFLDSHH
jgi:hypothetical protein